MSNFIVDNSFWEIFPDASVGVLILNNLDNTKESSDKVIKLLEKSNEEAKKHLLKKGYVQVLKPFLKELKRETV